MVTWTSEAAGTAEIASREATMSERRRKHVEKVRALAPGDDEPPAGEGGIELRTEPPRPTGRRQRPKITIYVGDDDLEARLRRAVVARQRWDPGASISAICRSALIAVAERLERENEERRKGAD